jgi:hypothetical protein
MRRLLGEPRFPGHDIKEGYASQSWCIVLAKSDSTSAAIPPPPDAQTCDLRPVKGLRNPGRRVKHCGRLVIGIRPREAYETT